MARAAIDFSIKRFRCFSNKHLMNSSLKREQKNSLPYTLVLIALKSMSRIEIHIFMQNWIELDAIAAELWLIQFNGQFLNQWFKTVTHLVWLSLGTVEGGPVIDFTLIGIDWFQWVGFFSSVVLRCVQFHGNYIHKWI